MNQINTVIFDFDGTIADSFQKTLGAIIKIANDYGVEGVSKIDIELYRKKDLREVIKEAKVPVYRLPFLIKRGQREIAKVIESVKPFKGMVEVIRELDTKDIRLGILTTNSEGNVRKFLKDNKIDIFDFIYSGTSLFGKGKALRRLIKDKKLEVNRIVYVGDETRDIQAAHETGIRAVAVTWGFNTKEPLLKENPDWIADKPEQLLKIFASEI
jgi:phosphoglycolate phosphatase